MEKLAAFFISTILLLVSPIEKSTGIKILPQSFQSVKEIQLTVTPRPDPSEMPISPVKTNSPVATIFSSEPVITITEPPKRFTTGTIKVPERLATRTVNIPKKILDKRLPSQDSNLSVYFVKPSKSQVFRADETIEILAEVQGEASKVEFYVGSGQLFKTLTAKPYQISFDIGKYVGNIKENYKLPLEVKAYRSDNSSQYEIMTLNIVPSGSDVPQSVPTIAKQISFKEIQFVRDISSTNFQARAEGTYSIDSYDPFNQMTSVKTRGKAYGLKANTEYDVFAITKRGSMLIGSLNTDGNGYGEFFTGIGTDQHYCDIYQLGIKEKGLSDDRADLWSQDLDNVCPKG